MRQRWNLVCAQRKTGSTDAGDGRRDGHLDREGGGSVSWPLHVPDLLFELEQQGSMVKGFMRLPGGLVSAPFAARLFPGPVTGTVAGDVFRFQLTSGSLSGEMNVSRDEMIGQVSMMGSRPLVLRRGDSSSPLAASVKSCSAEGLNDGPSHVPRWHGCGAPRRAARRRGAAGGQGRSNRLPGFNLATNRHLPEAFRQGLRDLGYVEGRNVVFELPRCRGEVRAAPRSCGRTGCAQG